MSPAVTAYKLRHKIDRHAAPVGVSQKALAREYTRPVDPRLERVAKNESLFRAVNQQIEHITSELGEDDSAEIEVLCECGREGCDSLISLPAGEYDRVHFQLDRFVLAPGHATSEIENVVEEHDGWIVVDKFGDAEEIAERG